MKNNGWVSVKNGLPESGQEVLIYFYDVGYEIDQINIAVYYKKGSIIDTKISEIDGPLEEKLLDTLFNPQNEIRALEDGFYIFEGDEPRKHADIITHWQPLPEPPARNDIS